MQGSEPISTREPITTGAYFNPKSKAFDHLSFSSLSGGEKALTVLFTILGIFGGGYFPSLATYRKCLVNFSKKSTGDSSPSSPVNRTTVVRKRVFPRASPAAPTPLAVAAQAFAKPDERQLFEGLKREIGFVAFCQEGEQAFRANSSIDKALQRVYGFLQGMAIQEKIGAYQDKLFGKNNPKKLAEVTAAERRLEKEFLLFLFEHMDAENGGRAALHHQIDCFDKRYALQDSMYQFLDAGGRTIKPARCYGHYLSLAAEREKNVDSFRRFLMGHKQDCEDRVSARTFLDLVGYQPKEREE